jgi:hypothetical protein
MAAAAEAVKTSPLARVKEEFGGKDKLVDKIVGMLDSDESKDELRKRLLGVANSKLIRLFSTATKTKQAGGHDKLVATTAEKLNRAKDKDYVTKLGDLSNGRLLDMLQSAERRSGVAAAAKAGASAQSDGTKPPVARAARAPKPAAPKAAPKAAAKAKKPAAKKPAKKKKR